MKNFKVFALAIMLFGLVLSPSFTAPQAALISVELDPKLKSLLSDPLGSEEVEAIITYKEMPLLSDLKLLETLGFETKVFNELPMIAIKGNVALLNQLLLATSNILSIYSNEDLQYFLRDSRELIGAESVWNDLGYTGKGVTVAVIDSGIDATHQDLVFGEKVVQIGRAHV